MTFIVLLIAFFIIKSVAKSEWQARHTIKKIDPSKEDKELLEDQAIEDIWGGN